METSEWIAARMSDIVDTLAPLSRPGEPYALLDWPNHSNIGDSAIWLGEIAWARQYLRRMPDYASTSGRPANGLDLHCPEGTLLICGGGNFGDVWKQINDGRIDLLDRYRHRRIIQLPQSIHFSCVSELERTQRAIDAHPDFTLLVRDTASLNFARQNFDCEALLCPDMALMLGPLRRPVAFDVDIFSLMRTDKERAYFSEVDTLGPKDDWVGHEHSLLTQGDRLRSRIYQKAFRHKAPRFLLQPLMDRHIAMMNRLAELRLQRGLKLLARGRRVLTDRLHGHILCTLMDIPHVVLDNSYRKLTNFITTWPPDGLTMVAADMTEASAMLAALDEAEV